MNDTNGYGGMSVATPQDVAAMRTDPLSPTVIAQQFLQKQGLPLTSENMRRALTANANNPGYIPGLVNNEPPTMPIDVTGERSGAAPTAQAAQPMPTPPIPPQATVQNSTQPSTPDDPARMGVAEFLTPVLAATVPIIATAIARMLPIGGNIGGVPAVPSSNAEFIGNRGVQPTGRMTDVPNPAIGVDTRTALPPTGDAGRATIAAPDTPPVLPGTGGAQAQIPAATGVERAQMRTRTHPKVPVRIRVR